MIVDVVNVTCAATCLYDMLPDRLLVLGHPELAEACRQTPLAEVDKIEKLLGAVYDDPNHEAMWQLRRSAMFLVDAVEQLEANTKAGLIQALEVTYEAVRSLAIAQVATSHNAPYVEREYPELIAEHLIEILAKVWS